MHALTAPVVGLGHRTPRRAAVGQPERAPELQDATDKSEDPTPRHRGRVGGVGLAHDPSTVREG